MVDYSLKESFIFPILLSSPFIYKTINTSWQIVRYGSTISIRYLMNDMLLRNSNHPYVDKIFVRSQQKLNDRKYKYALKTTIPLWFSKLLFDLRTKQFFFIDENGNVSKDENKLFITVFGEDIFDDVKKILKESKQKEKQETMLKLALKLVRFFYPKSK